MQNTITEINAELAFQCRNQLGEGPVWHPEENALYWIDLIGKKLFRGDAATGKVVEKDLPYRCARVTLCDDDRMLFSFTRGLALGSYASDSYQPLSDTPVISDGERFNDGACDSRGRYWTGTYDALLASPIGGIYCIDAGKTLQADSGVRLANGLRWNPDETRMYFADSRPGKLWVYDFDLGAARISNRQLFVDYEGTGVKPDGCATDTDGCVWVAEVHRSQVARYTPEGKLDQVVKTPTRRPTSVSFGGADNRTLFITTRADCMSEEELTKEPLAGTVLSARVPVPGLQEYKYRTSARA
jgi:sugar lactone lactonase YvrE